MNKIATKTFQIPLMPRNAINMYLADGYVFDAGIKKNKNRIIKALNGYELKAHVLTHAHPDHNGASKAICEYFNIPLWCGEKDKDRAESGFVTEEYPNNQHWLAKLQNKYWAGAGYKVSKTLKEGDKVGSFTVIETPGHSSGHLSFFSENDGVLIVGDVLTNMNLLTTRTGLHLPPNIFTVDPELNLKSVKKLIDLNPRIWCFGHGPILLNTDNQVEKFYNKMIRSF